MKDLITIFIPSKPVPKGRPRAVRMGDTVRAYTPKRTRSFESRIAYVLAERYDRPPAQGPLDVTMAIALPVPASWPSRNPPTPWHIGSGNCLLKTTGRWGCGHAGMSSPIMIGE